MFLHTSIGGDERFAEETTATSCLGKTHRSSRTKSKCVRVGERACVGTAWSSTAPLARCDSKRIFAIADASDQRVSN